VTELGRSGSDEWEALLSAERLADLIRDGDAAHDVSHMHRTWKNALAIHAGEGYVADLEIVRPAVFLHDLVSLPKNDRRRSTASRKSADQAVFLLRKHGFPSAKLCAVHHAIVAHSQSANVRPETLEARIVQDADRLDALGTVGLARAFFVAGTIGQLLFSTGAKIVSAENRIAPPTAMDHINMQLYRLARDMTTATGRRIATERLKPMSRYLSELAAELDGSDLSQVFAVDPRAVPNRRC
jgi:uncharacterized protein